jgi:hypothetical protein
MREITIDGVRYELHPVEEPPKSIIVLGVSTFKVYLRDIARPMSWYDAVQWCEDLVNGWWLPTRVELLIMYEHREEIGGFKLAAYWSSSEANSYDVWFQQFSNGYKRTAKKTSWACSEDELAKYFQKTLDKD